MKRGVTARLAVVVSLALSMVLAPALLLAAAKPGQPAPNFKVVTTGGQPVSLDNYRNHVLIIDFFATWCHPCRQSVPHLVDLTRKYGKQGLQVLGLSADENGERFVKTFADEFQVNYPLALAGDAVTVDYGIRSVPVMFVIDKKGKLVEVFRGYTDDVGRSVETLVKRLLAEK